MLLKLKTANCLNEIFINKPLKTAQEFIFNNDKYWGPQVNKLPITLFSNKQIKLIDKPVL